MKVEGHRSEWIELARSRLCAGIPFIWPPVLQLEKKSVFSTAYTSPHRFGLFAVTSIPRDRDIDANRCSYINWFCCYEELQQPTILNNNENTYMIFDTSNVCAMYVWTLSYSLLPPNEDLHSRVKRQYGTETSPIPLCELCSALCWQMMQLLFKIFFHRIV